jgi:GntR family transcriptional repressor for pyruvate dehydrogenase complex
VPVPRTLLLGGPADLERLKKCLDEMIVFKNDAEKYAYADLNFHINIALATQNRVSYQMLLMIKEVLFSHFKINTEKLKDKFDEDLHIKIYEAISNRDPEAAEKNMIKLLDTNIDLLRD